MIEMYDSCNFGIDAIHAKTNDICNEFKYKFSQIRELKESS